MNCITSVLQTEKEINVKRAALLVIKMLLEGLGKDTMQVCVYYTDFYLLSKLLADKQRQPRTP